jgi:hypothetical protein
MQDNNGKVIKLRTFNPRVMEKRRIDPNGGPPSIVLIGSKATGKTYLIQDLMYYFRKIPTGLIITGSEGSSRAFSKFFPKICIHNGVNDALIKRIEMIVKKQRKLLKLGANKEENSCFILFDDCGYDNKSAKSEIIRGIFMNGRHWNTLVIMSVQYCRSIGPELRKNVDYVFILREPKYNERKKLYEDFGGIVGTEKDFSALLQHHTENYQCLVIDNTSQSNDLRDNIYKYRARYPPRKFRVGSPKLWDYHEKYYKSDDESDSDNELIKLSDGKLIVAPKSKKAAKRPRKRRSRS